MNPWTVWKAAHYAWIKTSTIFDLTPQGGTLDLISLWQVQDRGGSFFGTELILADGGTQWPARLTGQQSCHWGPGGGDVQGDGVCGSGDKHHREYERHDGYLSQEVRLYHCRRNHRREADLVRLCCIALWSRPELRRPADRKTLTLTVGRFKHQRQGATTDVLIVTRCLNVFSDSS